MENFTHINPEDQPAMVDVGAKDVTKREAVATSRVRLTPEIAALLEDGDIRTKKGPVFQTAVIAGIMACKKTSDLIPMCHPLPLSSCNIDISMKEDAHVLIRCQVKVTGKTGVEMEALTGASIAALTIYDMCKSFSHDIAIIQTQLEHKSGGKSLFTRKS